MPKPTHHQGFAGGRVEATSVPVYVARPLIASVHMSTTAYAQFCLDLVTMDSLLTQLSLT